MKLYTSSWFSYFGPGRIGISRGSPRGMAGGYKLYRDLAPTRDMLKMPRHEYEPLFFEILGRLDPNQVLSDLEDRSDQGIAVMLCFEKPPFTETNFCHRRMVARWLETKTGIHVPEWSGSRESNPVLPLDAAE